MSAGRGLIFEAKVSSSGSKVANCLISINSPSCENLSSPSVGKSPRDLLPLAEGLRIASAFETPFRRGRGGLPALPIPALSLRHHDLAQVAQRTVLDDADGRHALADDVGNFPVVHLLNEAQHDHLSLLVTQLQHRLAHALLV